MTTSLFVREDWTLFRTLATICQKSGVAPEKLRSLVAKELADNALDACGQCSVGVLADGGFYVENPGPGIEGNPEEIGWIFSIRRPLATSKTIRRPTRGALGNGLRVVAGVVFASGGTITVFTAGRRLLLTPQESGETSVESEPTGWHEGTRVEVRLGKAVPEDTDFLAWAELAIAAAGNAPIYKSKKTSPHFYDSDSFFELLCSCGERTVRDVIEEFEGCSGKAGEIASQFLGRRASSLTYEESESLLRTARELAKPVSPKRLSLLGKNFAAHHAKEVGVLHLKPDRGSIPAELPYTVEAWAAPTDKKDSITMLVNRTPVTASIDIARSEHKTTVAIFGCGLHHRFKVGRKPVALTLNVQTPYMAITSDGKEPNLKLFLASIQEATSRAARKCQRANATPKEEESQKAVILANLQESIEHAGGGRFRFSERTLYYSQNHIAEGKGQAKPAWSWFCKVITEFENQQGFDIPQMYRDDRGSIYHPHLKIEMPLGTRMVEEYERPKWVFNKILYCEKEGLLEILKSAGWPEKHDCALLTSKGYATRAARDVIDLLGETDEELLFFAIHDADAYGTCIYQFLQEATRARPGRRVRIVNLGLEPWQGLDMGLQVENVKKEKGERRKPVGAYVATKSREWERWLQTKRIELNAMTTPQFLAWLDAEMEDHGNGKLIPPQGVMADHLADTVRKLVAVSVRERILREAGFATQVEEAVRALGSSVRAREDALSAAVTGALSSSDGQSWRTPVEQVAEELVRTSRISG